VEEGARDASLQWLDLGLGDEPYKERYVNNVRQTRYVHLSRGLGRHIATLGRQLLNLGVTRFPAVGNKLRNARTLCQSFARQVNETGFFEMARQSACRAVKRVASIDEVLFFEAPKVQALSIPALQLLPLTREHLVEASISSAGDEKTLAYLMRCARRLKLPGSKGFFLQNDEGRPVHFLWIGAYDGFRLAEIDHTLELAAPNAVMIFDCWTPVAHRGRGYYPAAIRLAAAQSHCEGRDPWIFGAARNQPSLQGIIKAGFTYRYSLLRRTRLNHSSITRRNTTEVIMPSLAHPIQAA
jgi:hypothetical protein